ncbi:protease, partial [Streptomyces sp. DSM 41014]|nr:protease [Streptomyces sp. DSM 41014]
MATTDLGDRRILAIVTNYGVEQDELVVPVKHLRDHGAQV